ncbi:hypothetical protein GCM10009682_60800 [Luedemannella flava]|uniref:Uncharacterized protein n=1 Tax=Luedemannella flava TaxID=349316 RepID=A0ABP4Z0V9_9ACTN
MSTEVNEPNEYGFSGEGTTPEPEPDQEDQLHAEAEAIAVPSDDLTDPLSNALLDLTGADDEE